MKKAPCESCWYDEFANNSTTTDPHKMQLKTILNHVTNYKPFVIASAEFSDDQPTAPSKLPCVPAATASRYAQVATSPPRATTRCQFGVLTSSLFG